MSDDPPISWERPLPARAWLAWAETAALCALALGAGAVAGERGCAWLALAPLLAGLRHGASRGVACGAAQTVALVLAARQGWVAADAQVAEVALGWLLAGLLPGQVRDAWSLRLRQAEGEAGELRRGLAELARSYHVLKASHDRLQREVPGCPPTLREALEVFERELGGAAEAPPVEAIGARVLAVFRECASMRAGTLHLVDGHGRAGPAVAALGPGGGEGRDGGDTLIREAVRLRQVVSLRDLPAGRDVLAAVPLLDAEGWVRAVVAIRDLPFLALHADTLALLAALGGYAGNALARALDPPPAAAEQASFPPARPFGRGSRGAQAVTRGDGLAP